MAEPIGYQRMRDLLGEYGLGGHGGLTDWLHALMVDGASDDTIAIELERTPQFKARFGAREQIRQWNLANPLDQRHIPAPAEILEYEQTVTEMMRRANVPVGFYDTYAEIQQLMVDGKSVNEIKTNLDEGFLRVTTAPREVQDAFNDFFGAQGPAALAAYFLDPDLAIPAMERQVRQAEIAGTGRRFGVDVNEDRSDRLAEVGVDINSATAGFGRVNELRSLYGRTVAEQAEDELTAEGAGVDFAFGLDGGQSKARLVGRQERRAADFAGVGGAAEAKDGLAGLGSAD